MFGPSDQHVFEKGDAAALHQGFLDRFDGTFFRQDKCDRAVPTLWDLVFPIDQLVDVAGTHDRQVVVERDLQGFIRISMIVDNLDAM